MDSPWLPYIFIVFLLACSAFFSGSEIAYASVNKLRLKKCAERGERRNACLACSIRDNYGEALCTILIGNNLVNIASSSVATVIAIDLMGEAGAVYASALMTVFILLFGEIMPKTLARTQPEKVSILFAPILRTVQIILTPIVWCFVQLNKLLVPGKQENDLPSVTEDELKSILSTAEAEGVLNEQETDILHSVIEFDDTTVQEILTPRVDMEAIDVPPWQVLSQHSIPTLQTESLSTAYSLRFSVKVF